MLIVSVTASHRGGEEKYFHDLATALGRKLGKRRVFLVPVADETPLADKDLAYTIASPKRCFKGLLARLGEPWSRYWTIAFCCFLMLRYRIGHILCGQVNVVSPCRRLATIFRKPYTVFAVGIEVWRQLPEHKLAFLRGASLVVPISDFTRQQVLAKGIPGDRTFVLSPCVDVHTFRPGSKPNDILQRHGLTGKQVLLTAARLREGLPYKGQDMVIKALPQIIASVPNTVYLIVGSGPDKPRLEQLVKDVGLESKVIFAGSVSDAELPLYYNVCDVFVMPSRVQISADHCWGEGFGIVFLEASACGKPVIGGNVGGTLDPVDDGVSGILVDPTNVAEIAEVAIKLLIDKDYAGKLGAQGRQRVVEKFSLECLEDRTDDLLKQIESLARNS